MNIKNKLKQKILFDNVQFIKSFNKILFKFYYKHKYYSYAVPVIISIIILLIIGRLTNVFNDIYYWIGALIMIFQIVIITFIYFESLEFRLMEFKEYKRHKEHTKAVRTVTHKPIFSQFKQLINKTVKNIDKHYKQFKSK